MFFKAKRSSCGGTSFGAKMGLVSFVVAAGLFLTGCGAGKKVVTSAPAGDTVSTVRTGEDGQFDEPIEEASAGVGT